VRAAIAVAVAVSLPGVAGAQSLPADPEPAQDCSLLADRERSPSWLRHVRWSLRGGSRGPHRIFSPSVGVNLWTAERLCRREPMFESQLVYHRVAFAARVDYEHALSDRGHSGVRPALELSSGNSTWAWLGIAAAAGPRWDDRGMSASGSVSAIALGLDMEVRVDTGVTYDGHEIAVLFGVSDLHLLLPALFADYQPD